MSKPFKSKPRVEIKVVQVWRDKDRRREEDGTVRKFVILHVDEVFVSARETWRQAMDEAGRGPCKRFYRFRFGSGSANDSFELVGSPAPAR